MKYPISKELKSISIYSGSMVDRLYPLVNFAYGFIKCKSDDFVRVKKYSTPGYDGAEISTLLFEPRQYEGELPCIMFFHGGGFLMRASAAHYQIAKWYARQLKCKVVMPDSDCFQNTDIPLRLKTVTTLICGFCKMQNQ